MMDIYQCMGCGERWTHGGLRESMIAVAQHQEQFGHLVLVGEIDNLAELYKKAQNGTTIAIPAQTAMPSRESRDEPVESQEEPGGRLESW